jgi:carboxypeptidase family protein
MKNMKSEISAFKWADREESKEDRSMETHNFLWIVWLTMFLFAGTALAQVNTGTISGTVKDGTGAVLPGAQVVILNDETGVSRTLQTDSGGRYVAPSLSLGNYRVTATQEGFQTEVRIGIALTVGREAVVDLVLSVGAVNQTVEVMGEAPLVESTTASLGSLVDDRTIRALPLNGRSYDQLALLQPGVVLFDTGPIAGTAFGSGTGKHFSVGGSRSYSNSFLLDGTNINDQSNGTPGGAAGTNLGVDTIREFKIFTNSFKAEYGHSDGSVVSAVTRSGTNNPHGTAFEYIRNSALDARNFFDTGSSPPPFRRNQFGGVLGGPIKKDKTFLFGGYEGLRQGLANTLIATVPTVASKQGNLPTGTVVVNPASVPFLNLYPNPNGRDFGDGSAQYIMAPTAVTGEDNFMVRLDHSLTPKTSIFGRYTFDDDRQNLPLSIPGFAQTNSARRQYSTIQANTILGPKTLNNFRFAYNRSFQFTDQIATTPLGPGYSLIPGLPMGPLNIGAIQANGNRALTPIGTNSAFPRLFGFNVFEWGDDFSYVTGKHFLKTGVDLQRIRDNTALNTFLRGGYTFNTFTNLLTGTPSNMQASSPLGKPSYFGLRQSLYAVYGQDDYTVNSRLTLNLGLRWETATDPTEVNGMMAFLPSFSATQTVISGKYFSIGKKNFEPRVGLAWQLNESGKTVLRAGAGIYHNQILTWAFDNQTRQPPYSGTLSVANPIFPNGYQVLAGGPVRLLSEAPFDKTPVSDQYNLSIQQQLFKDTVIQIAYAGNKANHLLTQRQVDTPIPTILPDGRKFFPAGSLRQNPAWAGISVYETDGNSVYNSVSITLRRQSTAGLQYQVSYTRAKAMDEATNTNANQSVRSPSSLMDPQDRGRDWGLAEFDARNAFVYNFSYPLPFKPRSRAVGAVLGGWSIDGIGTFTSGLPFTARLSVANSRNQDTTLSERPDLAPGKSQNPNHGTTAGCPGIPAGQPLGSAFRFYDPCSFSLPLAGTYGNLGRNTITGPGVANVDFSLEKNFKLREKASVTFRAELFNIFNHTNFSLPNTSALNAAGAANASAGVITATTTFSRQIQFALRMNF